MAKLTHALPLIARLLLGLIFFVFGLNGFLQFLPMPPMPDRAGAFIGALAATGYLFPWIKATEVVVGLLLLSNRFVPLALLLAAPITLNIAAFHLFLDSLNPLSILLVAGGMLVAWQHRAAYAVLFRPQMAAART